MTAPNPNFIQEIWINVDGTFREQFRKKYVKSPIQFKSKIDIDYVIEECIAARNQCEYYWENPILCGN